MSTEQIQKKRTKSKTAYSAGMANLESGQSRIIEINGRSIGVFNVNGEYFAMHNRCPHMGAPLCEGPISGTSIETDKREFIYGMENELVRCAWHGWEFEIKSGRCLTSDIIRARTFPVSVENSEIFVHF